MSLQRITMFKAVDDSAQDKLIEAYTKLASDNKKDGKSYISECVAYKLYDDKRSGGFNIAAKTTFANLDDMKYYDEQCEAHAELKRTAMPLLGGPPMCFYYDA